MPSSTRADIAQPHRMAVDLAQDDVAEAVDAFDAAASAQRDRLRAPVDAAARDVGVLRLQCARDVVHRQPLRAQHARRSSQTLIWRLRPPMTTHLADAVGRSRAGGAARLSANSVMSRTGLSRVTATVITGEASGSSFSTIGCGRPSAGGAAMTRLTRSRTSCAATSVFFSSLKETTTCEMPSDEVEVSSSMPLMVLTASSILSVISVSICSGAAPGRRVVTMIDRDVDVGEAIDAELTERVEADNGQGQNQHPGKHRALDAECSANHCIAVTCTEIGMPSTSSRGRRRRSLAGLDPTRHFSPVAFNLSRDDDALLGPAMLAFAGDDEHARRAGNGADRRGRDQDRVLVHGLIDVGGGEEARLQPAVAVGDSPQRRARGIRRQRRRHEANLAREVSPG